MNIKIFCRCSLFPSWSGYDLSAPLYNVKKELYLFQNKYHDKGTAVYVSIIIYF
jgi:hypothetical protein